MEKDNNQQVSLQFLSESERALLSIAYKDQQLLVEIDSQIEEDYFLFIPNRNIYNALKLLLTEVERVDFNTLLMRCLELGMDRELLNKYLPIICNSVFDPATINYHLNEVKQAYLKYKLYDITSKTVGEVYNNKKGPNTLKFDDLVTNLNNKISHLEAYRKDIDNLICFGEEVESLLKEYKENKTEVRGLRTGFPELDRRLNGLCDGTVTVFAARKKEGKSTLILNIANHISYESQQGSVLMFSTEMYPNEDLARLLSMRTYVEERDIINGIAQQDPEKREVLELEQDYMKNSKCQIYHQYIPNFTVSGVISQARHWIKKHPDIKLFVFDYIKIPPSRTEDQQGFNEYQMLGELSTALKNFAGNYKIPVLTAAQLNRSNEVADSDKIGRFVNSVIYFRRKTKDELDKCKKEYDRYGTHYMDIRDTRAGGKGRIPVSFYKRCLKMMEAEFNEDEENENDEINKDLLTTPKDNIIKASQRFSLPVDVSPDQNLDMFISPILQRQSAQEDIQNMREQIGANSMFNFEDEDDDI